MGDVVANGLQPIEVLGLVVITIIILIIVIIIIIIIIIKALFILEISLTIIPRWS